MKTILILLPVFVSALFAVSTQVRDTAYGPIQQTLADRPADTLPLDNIGDPS